MTKIKIKQIYINLIFLSTKGKCIKYSKSKNIPKVCATKKTTVTLSKYEQKTSPISSKGSNVFKLEYLDFN